MTSYIRILSTANLKTAILKKTIYNLGFKSQIANIK